MDRDISPHWVFLTQNKTTKTFDITSAQINHYMYRDQHFFLTTKIPRRENIGTGSEELMIWEAACNNDNDLGTKILRFVAPLKKRMGFIPE